MLQPKRTKFRKSHRGRRNGLATKGVSLSFGDYGIRALQAAWLTARQIEAARRTITHHLKRGGQVWIRVFPDKAVTSKPLETRQGSGKGAVDHWVAVVRRGKVLFEVAGVDGEIAKEALWLACRKLPIPTKIISRSGLFSSDRDGAGNEN